MKTVVGLAQTLGIDVVAEGIETAEQFEMLRSLGCSRGQGYFFHKPLPARQARETITVDNVCLLADPNPIVDATLIT